MASFKNNNTSDVLPCTSSRAVMTCFRCKANNMLWSITQPFSASARSNVIASGPCPLSHPRRALRNRYTVVTNSCGVRSGALAMLPPVMRPGVGALPEGT